MKWRAYSKIEKIYKKFQSHWIVTYKECRQAIKLSVNLGKGPKHSANHTEEAQQDIAAMFTAAIATFSNTAEESIHAAIDKQVRSMGGGAIMLTGVAGNGNDAIATLKKLT